MTKPLQHIMSNRLVTQQVRSFGRNPRASELHALTVERPSENGARSVAAMDRTDFFARVDIEYGIDWRCAEPTYQGRRR